MKTRKDVVYLVNSNTCKDSSDYQPIVRPHHHPQIEYQLVQEVSRRYDAWRAGGTPQHIFFDDELSRQLRKSLQGSVKSSANAAVVKTINTGWIPQDSFRIKIATLTSLAVMLSVYFALKIRKY